tara:strand:- start:3303 stop:3557 length:255 start_codon:yes stop_codon:yes gene_type:complete
MGLSMIEKYVKPVRDFLQHKQVTKKMIAEAAQINPAILNGIEKDDWNPTFQNFIKIAAAVERLKKAMVTFEKAMNTGDKKGVGE